MSQDNVVIVSGVRTPMGGFMGSLAPVSAPELGAIAIAEAVKRAGLQDVVARRHAGSEIGFLSDDYASTGPIYVPYTFSRYRRFGANIKLDYARGAFVSFFEFDGCWIGFCSKDNQQLHVHRLCKFSVPCHRSILCV